MVYGFSSFFAGIPPQHTPLGPPSSYYGGQEHHKYHENGHHPPHHENVSDFVTLVCQETAQHQAAAHHPQAHQAATHHLRAPYAGYAPPIPPVSAAAASHRGRTHGEKIHFFCESHCFCFDLTLYEAFAKSHETLFYKLEQKSYSHIETVV